MSYDQPSLLPEDDGLDPVALATAAALRSRDGYFNELTGRVHRAGESTGALHPLWQRFWRANGLAGWLALDARAARVQRRVQEDGASYNVHSNTGDDVAGQARHWPLELLPMLVSPADWAGIEAGVVQRARLLNAAMADVYGPQSLLREGLLPAPLVLAHPHYLRPLHGCVPPGGVHLHVLAFDIARLEDGRWWVVGQRVQAPSGLGYMLENRLIVAQQFPEAFREMGVQRLAASYRDLLAALMRLSPAGGRSRVALLTPGPRNETYFEHAFLARYLGISLVEGADLTVRDDKVFLKTLAGLERVHVLLRRVDDEFLDPLELRADSILGVPGLLQALRAGEVVVANAPGAGWLESPGLARYWSGVSLALLGEPLKLPTVEAHWCGEAIVWRELRPRLRDFVVMPSFAASETTPSFAPMIAADLSDEALATLLDRIDAQPAAFSLRARVRPSKQPVWHRQALEPRVAVMRVYALADGVGGWRILPGGLTRVAPRRDAFADAWLSIQRGGLSVDTWVLTDGEVDATSLLPAPMTAADLEGVHWTVTSRAAENLFWLGRYSERAENSARLARLILDAMSGAARGRLTPAMLDLFEALAREHGLLNRAVRHRDDFEQALIRGLPAASGVCSVGFNLGALQNCAQALRERLSTESWKLLHEAGAQFERQLAESSAVADVIAVLSRADTHLAAITGTQTDRMTRDDGWRLLSIGRQIERLVFFSQVMAEAFEQDLALDEDGFTLLLGLFDSTITYRAQFQTRREAASLLHLLVHDTDNPRSLAWVARTMRERFGKLARHDAEWAAEVSAELPVPTAWPLRELSDPAEHHAALTTRLRQAVAATEALSQRLSQRFFAHVEGGEQRVWQ